MRKMSPEERQSIETAASWQSHQHYDRGTILMLLNHIKAVEWDNEALIKTGKREAEVNERLTENVAQLQRELRQALLTLKVTVRNCVANQSPDDYISEQFRLFLKLGKYAEATAVEMVLEKLGKHELLHRLRNEVH